MKRTVKRILAVLLTAVMLLSVAPMSVFAKENVTDGTAEGVMSDVNLKATNSVGELVTKALEKNGLDAESEYGVTGLDFDGKTATVTGFAKENCALIVAIYDENSNRMLASGIGEFSEDEQTASVEISTTQMPEYFVAYAFLLDENGSALCDKFTSREHTHDFEKFYEKTVDDFDKDKVINLDKDKESNFVVLTDGAETVDSQSGKNKLVSSDDEKGIYVFENIDSDISSLKAGDVFRYEQKNEQDVLVIKVKSVSINGSTATVTSDDTDLTEVFDYVKIEGSTTGENTTVDMSEADEGVEYRRIEEETGEIQTSSFGYNDSKSVSSEFTIKEKKIKKNVKLSAKLTFKVSASVNVYYQRKAFADDYLDMSIKIEPSVAISFSLTGKAEKSFVKLGEIGIFVCPGVYIGFTPQFVVEVSGSISISGTIKGCIGYSYNSDEGFKNTSSPFDFKPKVEISVEVFIGINLKPHIAIIHEKIADASISGEIGFKIKASTDLSESATSKAKHDCKVCIDGDISFVIKFSAELKLFNSEKWKYGADLWNTSFKIADFYISVPYGFGWGVCPHKFYEVKFTVADLDYEKAYKISSVGAGILSGIITGSISTGLKAYELANDNFFKSNSSALISKGNVKGNGNSRYYLHGSDTWDGNIATVTDGVATLYYTNGDQTATVTASGYKSKDISFTINDSGKSLVVFLENDSGSDNPGGETGGSTSDGTGSNDSVFTGTEATGTVINFGSYPQSKVTDSSKISALDGVTKNWKSYNYYIGTGDYVDGNMTSSDYMQYADFLYGGEKYRAVMFSVYRPDRTGYASSTSNSYQDDNGYYIGNTYYFKYEPLKWRVLNADTGLMVCDSAIDSQPYNNYVLYADDEYWGDSNKNYYASNWEYSSLRAWLNNDFYNTAFNKTQQDRIKELTRENKSTYSSEYDSNPTSDKITLLSYDEVLNKNYGFNPSEFADDTARQRKGTDYAKCQGLAVSTILSYSGESSWWLRSPYRLCGATVVAGGGWPRGDYYNFVHKTGEGVVPALNLSVSSSASDGTGSNDSVFTGTEVTGTIINFGSYPQSKVTDSATISVLDSVTKNWKSYNYYSGTGSLYDGNMKPSDYMKYADIVFNGNKYRAVTFSKYRPRFTGDTFSSSYINQDYNGYYTGNVYYFKYEPLKWRVLDASMGLVVCDSIIDSQAYNNYILESNGEYYGDSGKNHYASDWENSSLRKWLNEDFYNTAFSKLQQDRIQKLTRENWSTNESKYDSNPTSDKITLLSYYDALNTFNSTSITKDGARRRKGTDYAKCQGVGVVSDYGGTYDWWLRSPDESCYATEVGYDGRVNNFYCNVYATHRGVVPALNLGKSTISTSSIHTGEIAAYETEVEEKLETSPAIQTVYTPLKNGEFTLGSAVDGNGYMVYGVTDYTDGFTLTSDNLVYIDQSEGKDGKVTLTYKPSRTDSATVIVVGDFGSGIEARKVEFKTGYTVTWNIDGKTVTEIYAAGDKLTPPTVPSKSGYTFKGWDKSVPSTMPASDLTFTAVYEKNVEKKNVKSVSIDDISLNYKKSTTLKPTIKADDGAKYKVEYSTSNAKVATVDENGKVTATKRGSGTATITCTVTDSNGNVVKDTCKVSVKLSFGQILIVYVLFGWIWY